MAIKIKKLYMLTYFSYIDNILNNINKKGILLTHQRIMSAITGPVLWTMWHLKQHVWKLRLLYTT